MATSLSLLLGPTNCPLSSFPLRSSVQNGLSVIPLAGFTSPRHPLPSSSPAPFSAALRGKPQTRPPLLRANPLMNVDVARSRSPNWTQWNGGARRLTGLHRRADSENSSDVAVRENSEENSDFLPPGWPTVALALFGLGFLLGPPLDGIHSRVQLQVYDNGAINLLGLQTNIWVPPLLGVFYSLTGLVSLVLDKKLARKGNIPTANLSKVAASYLFLAVLLEISAELYHAGVPANIEGYLLFFCAQLNWVLFENTWWGFGLAAFLGVVCPLSEIPIVKLFGLWHYPGANVSLFGEGFVTWVICCYFFYTPFISNLARWLVSYQKGLEKPKQ